MFALRQINNNYSDFAGTRSDFVVVGHPEYQGGKVPSESGYGTGWDTTDVKRLPKRSPAADRLRSTGFSRHVRRIAEVPVEPRQTLKERALARSRSSPQLASASSSSHGFAAGGGGSRHEFDAFLAEMGSPDKLPPCSPNRTSAGFCNHLRSQPVCKHYAAVQEDLKDLRARLKVAPESTKVELLTDDAWRYYAAHLNQARRNEANWRRSKLRATQTVQAKMSSTS